MITNLSIYYDYQPRGTITKRIRSGVCWDERDNNTKSIDTKDGLELRIHTLLQGCIFSVTYSVKTYK